MSKVTEGWSRNRGRKCPVESGTLVDLQLRGGVIHIGKFCDNHTWIHTGEPFDVMYYRLHKPAEQVEPFIEAVHAFNALAKVPHLDGPLQWRDRITEIDATTQALTTERADLVQKLASEGFALIGWVVEPVEDYGNIQTGDLVSVISICGFSDCTGLSVGDIVEVTSVDNDESLKTVSGGSWGSIGYNYKFHSRPSA